MVLPLYVHRSSPRYLIAHSALCWTCSRVSLQPRNTSIILVHIVQQCLPKDQWCRPDCWWSWACPWWMGTLQSQGCLMQLIFHYQLQLYILFLVLHLLYPIGFAHPSIFRVLLMCIAWLISIGAFISRVYLHIVIWPCSFPWWLAFSWVCPFGCSSSVTGWCIFYLYCTWCSPYLPPPSISALSWVTSYSPWGWPAVVATAGDALCCWWAPWSEKTTHALLSCIWWPSLSRDVSAFVQGCTIC